MYWLSSIRLKWWEDSMDDIFGLGKYINIERILKLENELYRPFWDIIASQQARYDS